MAFTVKSFLQRTVIVLVGGPALLYLFFRGGYLLLGLLVLISLLGLYEYYRMVGQKGYVPARIVGYGAALALYLSWYYDRFHLVALVLLLTLVISFLIQINTSGITRVVENIATTLFGLFYCVVLPCHLLWFHVPVDRPDRMGIPYGRGWLIVMVVLVWSFDIFSYLVGSWLGRRKLFPQMSPKKSWEGLVGGVVGIWGVFLGIVYFLNLTIIALDYLAIPLLTGAAALGGDLFESVLKRDTGVKDSASIIPGHGGILDRFDALFLAGPVLYWYFHLTRGLLPGGGL